MRRTFFFFSLTNVFMLRFCNFFFMSTLSRVFYFISFFFPSTTICDEFNRKKSYNLYKTFHDDLVCDDLVCECAKCVLCSLDTCGAIVEHINKVNINLGWRNNIREKKAYNREKIIEERQSETEMAFFYKKKPKKNHLTISRKKSRH